MIPASRQRNYLQSALYVIIASALAAILLERLLTYAEMAEKAAMEATISSIHAALYVRVAYLVLQGQHESLEDLPRRNPFTVTDTRATNYAGEFDAVPADVERGSWLYHRGRHELLYVPKLTRYVSAMPGDASPAALRYRLGVRRSSSGAITGVSLAPVGSARWEPVP